jgi:hypothetical protein
MPNRMAVRTQQNTLLDFFKHLSPGHSLGRHVSKVEQLHFTRLVMPLHRYGVEGATAVGTWASLQVQIPVLVSCGLLIPKLSLALLVLPEVTNAPIRRASLAVGLEPILLLAALPELGKGLERSALRTLLHILYVEVVDVKDVTGKRFRPLSYAGLWYYRAPDGIRTRTFSLEGCCAAVDTTGALWFFIRVNVFLVGHTRCHHDEPDDDSDEDEKDQSQNG